MRQYSWKLYATRFPTGLEIRDDIDEQGLFQTSISFPLRVIFREKQFMFFRKVSKWVQRKETK